MRVPCSQREEHKPAQPSWCRAHPLWSKLASLHTQGRTQIPRQLHHDIHAAHRQVSQSMDTRTKAALSHFTVYQGLPFPAHARGEAETDISRRIQDRPQKLPLTAQPSSCCLKEAVWLQRFLGNSCSPGASSSFLARVRFTNAFSCVMTPPQNK